MRACVRSIQLMLRRNVIDVNVILITVSVMSMMSVRSHLIAVWLQLYYVVHMSVYATVTRPIVDGRMYECITKKFSSHELPMHNCLKFFFFKLACSYGSYV